MVEFHTTGLKPKRSVKRFIICELSEISGSIINDCFPFLIVSATKWKYTSVFPEPVTPFNNTGFVVTFIKSKVLACSSDKLGKECSPENPSLLVWKTSRFISKGITSLAIEPSEAR